MSFRRPDGLRWVEYMRAVAEYMSKAQKPPHYYTVGAMRRRLRQTSPTRR